MTSQKNTMIIELPVDLAKEHSSVPGKGQYNEQARRSRLDFLLNKTGVTPTWISGSRLPSEFVPGNIENYIGTVEIPVGLAGPLLIHGSKGLYTAYPPLATTEGALVASIARGSRAITDSRGCHAQTISQCMVRAPVFKFRNLSEAKIFSNFIINNQPALKSEVEAASRFGKLRSVDAEVIGRIVHTRFTFDTSDAAGQNMTTKCTARACSWLLSQLENIVGIKPVHYQIEGNTSGDKKVSSSSLQKGRGTRVCAEVEISNDVLCRVLNCSADKFYEGYRLGVSGGIASGMMGYNINVANAVAAIFTATGQDIACVHESSLGHFHVERTEEGLYASMTLTNLIVGTVGGGTGLPGQRELLECIGCYGEGGMNILSEIICASCLALDLSTMAAVAAGEFAGAHARLGKTHPPRH